MALTSVSDALHWGLRQLTPHSSSAGLDAQVLLGHVLGLDRAKLLARIGQLVSAEQMADFEALVGRRADGEPVAYITGRKEFFGLELHVTPCVLVPRPETESLVEECLRLMPKDAPFLFADVGTGSGAIATAIAHSRPQARGYATDISEEAVVQARGNLRLYNLEDRVTVLRGDLHQPVPEPVHLIAANLPYVPPGEAEPAVARWEPQVAVFGGGDDGTATIAAFLSQAPRFLLPGGCIVMEVAHSQGALVAGLARRAFGGAEVRLAKDLAGYDRIISIITQSHAPSS